MSNEVEAIESDSEEEQHELIGKSIFWFKISPPDGNHIKVS